MKSIDSTLASVGLFHPADTVNHILGLQKVRNVIPKGAEFLWSAMREYYWGERRFFILYLVRTTAELTGEAIVDSRASTDVNSNRPMLTVKLNSQGSRTWAKTTGANVNKRIAIVVDSLVFCAPYVYDRIDEIIIHDSRRPYLPTESNKSEGHDECK